MEVWFCIRLVNKNLALSLNDIGTVSCQAKIWKEPRYFGPVSGSGNQNVAIVLSLDGLCLCVSELGTEWRCLSKILSCKISVGNFLWAGGQNYSCHSAQARSVLPEIRDWQSHPVYTCLLLSVHVVCAWESPTMGMTHTCRKRACTCPFFLPPPLLLSKLCFWGLSHRWVVVRRPEEIKSVSQKYKHRKLSWNIPYILLHAKAIEHWRILHFS